MLAMDSERSARLMLIAGVVAVLLIALGFVGFGYWNSVIKPRNRTVLEADGIKVSYSAMTRRMGYELQQHQEYRQSQTALLQVFPESVLQTLVNEITLVSRAPSNLGIDVDDSEVEQALRTKIAVGASADQRAYADALRKALKTSGLHESEYRRMVRADAIKAKVQQKFTAEVPATALQAKPEVISVATVDAANAVIARVKGGEDWATVAKEVSTDPNAKTDGGQKDYVPEGGSSPAYDSYLFSAPVGQVSSPLIFQTSNQTVYYVVRVADRADKPVTDAQKSTISTKSYNDWLSDQQSQMTIVKDFDSKSQTDAVVAAIGKQPKTQPTAAAPAQQQPPVQEQPVQPSDQQPPANPSDSGANPPAGSGANPPVSNQPVAPGGGNGQ